MTLLNITKQGVLIAIKDKECVKWPRKILSSHKGRDQSGFSHFHKAEGQLKHFVQNGENTSRAPTESIPSSSIMAKDRQTVLPLDTMIRGTIHWIVGYLAPQSTQGNKNKKLKPFRRSADR